MALYDLSRLLHMFAYTIWALIGKFVDMIERVFKSLAGVKAEPGQDIASNLIQHQNVQNIFWNLVAVSTALLIFFTIIKIIQQQYKEKDGGNPYIIVFRMFKGMLMFFFVTFGVIVGLYASGVVLRALDAATGQGNVTISGQIFRAMAQDANRMVVGKPDGSSPFARAQAVYFNRLQQNDKYIEGGGGSEDGSTNGNERYTIAEITGGTSESAVRKAKAEIYQKLNKWMIVNADGSLSPVTTLYDIAQDEGWWTDTAYDGTYWTNGSNDGDAWNKDGYAGFYGDAGYQNAMLETVTVAIQPSIDFHYSPIDIYDEEWKLGFSQNVPTTVTTMGSGVSSSVSYYKYIKASQTQRAVSEDNVFSIDISGGVSLQGSKASAKFNLDTFANLDVVDTILGTICANMGITYAMDQLFYMIPELPLRFNFSAVSIDLRVILRELLPPLVNALIEGLNDAMPGKNSEPWYRMGHSNDLPLSVVRYTIDSNGQKLWGALSDTWSGFIGSFESKLNGNIETAEKGISQVDSAIDGIQQQNNWFQYRALVDSYNQEMVGYIQDLAVLRHLYKNPNEKGQYENSLDSSTMYNYWDTDETSTQAWVGRAMQQCFIQMVNKYNQFKADEKKLRPTTYDMKTYVGRLYRPVFTTNWTDMDAPSVTLENIANGKGYSLNLTTNGTGGTLYQIVDWSVYNNDVLTEFTNTHVGVADVYSASLNEHPTDYIFMNYGPAIKDLFGACNTPYSSYTLQQGSFLWADLAEKDMKKTAGTDTPNAAPQSVRTSQALSATRAAQIEDIKAGVKALYAVNDDNDTTYDAGFRQSDIITFRNMEVSESGRSDNEENTISTLKGWLSLVSGLQFLKDATFTPVFGLSPDAVDALMASNDGKERYLLLADDTRGPVTTGAAQSSYIGVLSYTDTTTVLTLYEPFKINFFIGFIGIVTALTVYMNFTFGLIQRIVNLSVLYMLSPVTIAFYPFDDGQRFQGSFVKPFYQEAISAFAVIISLNIFVALIGPVQSAAKTAVGGKLGPLMGILALIAFCSMLPSIRDSICSMLGAGKMNEKSLSSVFKDASAALNAPRNEMRNLAGMAKDSRAVRIAGSMLDRGLRGSDKRRERMDKMKNWAKTHGPTGWIYNKYNDVQEKAKKRAKDKRDKIQDHIDMYRRGEIDFNTGLTGQERRIVKLQDKKYGVETVDSIRKAAAEGDRTARQKLINLKKNAKANNRSMEDQLALDQKTKFDEISQAAYAANAEKSNKDWWAKRAANGVVSAKNKVKGGIKTGVKSVQDTFKYTLVGDLAEALWHPATGVLATEKGSITGGLSQWFRADARLERLQKMTAAESAWRAANLDPEEVFHKQMGGAAEGLMQRDQQFDDDVKRVAAQKQAADELGDTTSAAFNKRWEELYRGVDGAKVDDKYMEAARTEVNDHLDESEEELKAKRKDVKGEMKGMVNGLLDKLQDTLGLKDDERLSAEAYKEMAGSAMDGENLNQIVARLSKAITSKTQEEITTALQSINYEQEISKTQSAAVQNNAVIDAAINYQKKTRQAREWAYQDLNIDIDSQGFKDAYEAYRNMYDVNKADGMIAQEDALREKYGDDISNPEYQRELNALHEKFTRQYERAANAIRNNRDIRRFDYSVRQIEKEQAEYVNMVGKQYRNRIDYHMKVNMSAAAKQLIATDTAVLELERQGDNIGAARMMDEAIDAAIRQDYAALEASGVDKNTVQKLTAWAQSGDAGLKELKSIRDYYDITRKFLGNAEGISGGQHIQAVRNQMAGMFRVIRNKQITEYLDREIANLGSEEGGLRRTLNIEMETIKTKFAGDTWNEIAQVMDLKDANGQKVQDLGAYLEDALRRASIGEMDKNSEEFQQIVETFGKMSTDWVTSKYSKWNGKLQLNRVGALFDGVVANFQKAARAMETSNLQDQLNNMKELRLSDSYQINNKIQDQNKKG